MELSDDPLLRPLETERLRVRPLEFSDLDDCHRLILDIGWSDPALTEAESLDRRRSWLRWTIDSYREFHRLRQPRYGERAIVKKSDGSFVGLIGLVPSVVPMGQLDGFGGRLGAPVSPQFGLFWAIAPAQQRQGFASEAARAFMAQVVAALQLDQVVATTEQDNAASIAVMRKLGMRIHRNPHAEPHWLQVVGVWCQNAIGLESDET
jgi:RimJ/RimL family protein N-acetyltransferase